MTSPDAGPTEPSIRPVGLFPQLREYTPAFMLRGKCALVFSGVYVGAWDVRLCLCECTCWDAVDRMWGWMSYCVCLNQWITLHAATHAVTQTFTWTDTQIHRIPSAMFGDSKPRLKRVHRSHKPPNRFKYYTWHLAIISIFSAPIVHFFRV